MKFKPITGDPMDVKAYEDRLRHQISMFKRELPALRVKTPTNGKMLQDTLLRHDKQFAVSCDAVRRRGLELFDESNQCQLKPSDDIDDFIQRLDLFLEVLNHAYAYTVLCDIQDELNKQVDHILRNPKYPARERIRRIWNALNSLRKSYGNRKADKWILFLAHWPVLTPQLNKRTFINFISGHIAATMSSSLSPHITNQIVRESKASSQTPSEYFRSLIPGISCEVLATIADGCPPVNVTNFAFSHLRNQFENEKVTFLPDVELLTGSAQTDEQMAHFIELEELRQSVRDASLSDDQRALFAELEKNPDASYEELASSLKVPVDKVRNDLYRLRKMVKLKHRQSK